MFIFEAVQVNTRHELFVLKWTNSINRKHIFLTRVWIGKLKLDEGLYGTKKDCLKRRGAKEVRS
jgi:hypothetical protein